MRVERIQPDYTLDELFQMDRENGANASKDAVAAVKMQPQPIPAEAEPETKSTPKEEELQEKVKKLNSTMEIFNRKFHFKVHQKTNRVIVQVLNSETGEVISEIPPEKVLDMMAGMEKAIGLIVDAKV